MSRRPLALLVATVALLLGPLSTISSAAPARHPATASTPSASTTTITTAEGDGFSTYGTASISAKVRKVSPGRGVPTGSVDWYDGESFLTTTALVKGRTTLPSTSLVPGEHQLVAQYTGDDTTLGSTSETTPVHVFKILFHVTLKAKPDPATAGRKVTLIATVKSPSKDVSPEGHYISYSGDGLDLQAAQIVRGKAVLAVPGGFSSGDHEIVAIYPDDGEYVAQSGTSIILHVD